MRKRGPRHGAGEQEGFGAWVRKGHSTRASALESSMRPESKNALSAVLSTEGRVVGPWCGKLNPQGPKGLGEVRHAPGSGTAKTAPGGRGAALQSGFGGKMEKALAGS